MDKTALEAKMRELLGFRVTERENDAVVEFYATGEGTLSKVRAVRPAQHAEVTMYLRLMGFVARVEEMGIALQTADARIKELMQANTGLGEERAEMQGQMMILSNDRDALKARIIAASKEIDSLQGIRDKLDRERDRLLSEKDEALTRVQELEGK